MVMLFKVAAQIKIGAVIKSKLKMHPFPINGQMRQSYYDVFKARDFIT